MSRTLPRVAAAAVAAALITLGGAGVASACHHPRHHPRHHHCKGAKGHSDAKRKDHVAIRDAADSLVADDAFSAQGGFAASGN